MCYLIYLQPVWILKTQFRPSHHYLSHTEWYKPGGLMTVQSEKHSYVHQPKFPTHMSYNSSTLWCQHGWCITEWCFCHDQCGSSQIKKANLQPTQFQSWTPCSGGREENVCLLEKQELSKLGVALEPAKNIPGPAHGGSWVSNKVLRTMVWH
jgi:hypothetical protein